MTAGMPNVSIAVPVYNGEAYLAESLTCLEQQGFRDFEVIILDNASTDRTRDIARDFTNRDPRFRLIEQPKNMGAMPNYLAGLQAAKGDFFLWRAFDDLSDADYIGTLRAALVANRGAALAVPRVRMVNMDGSNERLIGFPRLSGHPIVDDIRLMFGAHAGWFYGLWRRDLLIDPFLKAMQSSNMAWGNDHLALLPFLWRRQVVHAPAALFHQRLKKAQGLPKARNPVSLNAMQSARRDFAHSYRALLTEFGPREWPRRAVLTAAMGPYREKRCYRVEQLAKALFR